MLTPDQRVEFFERGVVRLPGAVDRAAVEGLRRRIWAQVEERLGVKRDELKPGMRLPASTVKPLKRSGAFDLLYSPAVCAAIDDLLGRDGWSRALSDPGLLLTLPSEGSWKIPHDVWHFDYRCPGGVQGIAGVQLFLCVDLVEPRGGGTLVVAGSHRLVSRIQEEEGPEFEGRSAEVRKRLRRTVPWMRELWSIREGEDREERFMTSPTEHEGIPLQVVELTGEPGDVIAMHPWIAHTLSANRRQRARIVLTDRVRAQPRLRSSGMS